MPTLALATVVATGLAGCAVPTGPARPGGGAAGEEVADLAGVPLTVFTWRPAGCQISAVLLVFHGVNRNAGTYRDVAAPLAQRSCMLVVAPLFDAARFPSWRYQRGGVVQGGAVLPRADWTVDLVPRLADWARSREARPRLPYVLLGHSAGSQFLSRVVAYGQGGEALAVLANPSTWVRPSLTVAAPYGFGGLPENEAALRRYLAAPVRVLLGGNDTGTRNLATGEEADEQGANRLERGQTVFAEAQREARRRGWPFGWTLAVVPGVGHSERGMFTSDAAFAATAARPAD